MAFTIAAGSTIAVLPTDNAFPWYTFLISLSATIYTIRMRFNPRMNRWIMDVADSQDNDILNSIPLVIGRNLTGKYTQAGIVGFFFVIDDAGQGEQPTRNSFGVTHRLCYYDPTGTT